MYIIAGLGNPGAKFEGTRHNMGFETVDRISEIYRIPVVYRKHKAMCGSGMIGSEKILLVKPVTYMNASGESIREVMDFYKEDPGHLIVIYDDISLEPGQLRIREKGSAGGHNGMKSIIGCLGTSDFPRIRIGIGEKPAGRDLADYVLGRYTDSEGKAIHEAQEAAVEAAVMMSAGDAKGAMNRFNTKKGAGVRETGRQEM